MNYTHDSQIMSYDFLVMHCCGIEILFQITKKEGRIISQMLGIIVLGFRVEGI